MSYRKFFFIRVVVAIGTYLKEHEAVKLDVFEYFILNIIDATDNIIGS